jgi:hypothetical protein
MFDCVGDNMLVSNGNQYFKTIKFSPFVGSRICRAGCPIFTIDKYGKYCFLDNAILQETIIKLPFYVKVLLKVEKLFNKN